MRKKILIGSMLVLTLLLLMPSIPAIQNIEDKTNVDKPHQSLLEEPFFIMGLMHVEAESAGYGVNSWWCSNAVYCKTRDSDWEYYGLNELTLDCFDVQITHGFFGFRGLSSIFWSKIPFIICGIVWPK